jgi:hypothetical protein
MLRVKDTMEIEDAGGQGAAMVKKALAELRKAVAISTSRRCDARSWTD